MYHENATPAETLAVSTDCTRLARDLMHLTLTANGSPRPDLRFTAAQLRAAAALALSLGEPLAHFLEDDAE
jgi:hypothetical protein